MYLQNQREDRTPARGQEFSANVPEGELTARAAKEDKNDTEMPSPKKQKIDGTNNKIDATRILRRKRRLEAPWRDTHNADPGGKKERMLTELTELTVTKNTPDLRTLVTTHQSWAKNNLPERKNLAHSSDRRGLQTVKEDELLCSLIRTAHEIHYR
jgi:hypothetical protein